ncbi:MAG: addiction module protein [Pirellulales bacterium]
MSFELADLQSLTPAEKLRIVEFLWDDLGSSSSAIPIPEWAEQEAIRRREEMANPSFGLTHEETWRRINHRNG